MNGILVIDKEQGWTAQDVVSKLRGITGERRIGHTGTLDPMATGVLPIVIGKATRVSDFLMADDKEYLCEITFGQATDTEDIWGNVIATTDQIPTEESFRRSLLSFEGPGLQTPPMYSAIKMGGKKLYELARAGKTVERPQREVVFHELELIEFSNDHARFRAKVSKGTYIRTLCKDLGEEVHSMAVMSALRRIRSGSFSIGDAITIGEFESLSRDDQLKRLIPMDQALNMPSLILDIKESERVLQGQRIPTDARFQDWVKVYGDSTFLGLGKITDGVLHVKKVLAR